MVPRSRVGSVGKSSVMSKLVAVAEVVMAETAVMIKKAIVMEVVEIVKVEEEGTRH